MLRPRGVDLHFEVELALVLGRDVRNLKWTEEEEGDRGGDWMDVIDCMYLFFCCLVFLNHEFCI